MKKIAIAFLIFFLWEPGAGATTLLRMNLDDLTSASHAVVYGHVVASRAQWNRDRTLIYTVYTIRPLEYLKGHLGLVFELREPGGELDGVGMTVPGVPKLAVGEEAVLFVWTDPRGGHQLTGFQQGALAVQTDPQTGAKMVDRGIPLGSAQTSAASGTPVRATSPLLVHLLPEIRSSAAKTQPAAATQ